MYQPHFTITNKILKNIGLIEAAREVIKNAPLLPLWEKRFQEEAMVRTVHHGTHIEGNRLSFTEVQKIVEGEKVVAREREVQEIINYREVVKFIEGWRGEDREVDEKTIKKLHKLTTRRLLSPDQCGVYRKTQVVVKDSQTGQVTFRPPPAIEVPYLIREFLSWLSGPVSNELHPVLKAGVVHYEVVHIHPFLDGNGRVARALATLILYKEGYDIRRLFSLEEYYDKDAKRYYQALQSVQETGRAGRGFSSSTQDLTPWLEYFTQGLAVELTRVKERLQRLSQDVALKEKLGGKQIYLSERQIKIIEYIRRVGFLQNKAFSVIFPMISEDTVLRELKSLIKKGIIKKRGRTKAARYVLK